MKILPILGLLPSNEDMELMKEVLEDSKFFEEENKVEGVRCVLCRSEFSDKEIEGANCCPKCGTECLPMGIEDDVTIKVNWSELRILGLWAERWAEHIEKEHPDSIKTIVAITTALEKQFPLKTPLMLSKEFEQLKQMYPDAKITMEET